MKVSAPLVHIPGPLDNDDRPARRGRPAGGPPKLSKKHHELIVAMIYGLDTDDVSKLTRRVQKTVDGETVFMDRPLQRGEPLQPAEAAQLIGLRLKNVRELLSTRIFAVELALEVQRMRDGARPAAMARLIELRDRTGAGKAADAKVQLAASMALLGETAGPKAATVTFNAYNSVAAQPGYSIDLSRGSATARVIDHGEAGTIVVADDQQPLQTYPTLRNNGDDNA